MGHQGMARGLEGPGGSLSVLRVGETSSWRFRSQGKPPVQIQSSVRQLEIRTVTRPFQSILAGILRLQLLFRGTEETQTRTKLRTGVRITG